MNCTKSNLATDLFVFCLLALMSMSFLLYPYKSITLYRFTLGGCLLLLTKRPLAKYE